VTAVRDGWWQRLGEWVRTVIGAPSYERYIEHMTLVHPNITPLDREDFVNRRLHARYSRPGARCC